MTQRYERLSDAARVRGISAARILDGPRGSEPLTHHGNRKL